MFQQDTGLQLQAPYHLDNNSQERIGLRTLFAPHEGKTSLVGRQCIREWPQHRDLDCMFLLDIALPYYSLQGNSCPGHMTDIAMRSSIQSEDRCKCQLGTGIGSQTEFPRCSNTPADTLLEPSLLLHNKTQKDTQCNHRC